MDPNQNNNPSSPKPDNTPFEPQEPTVIQPTTALQSEASEPQPVVAPAPTVPEGQGIVTGGAEPLFSIEPRKKSNKLAIVAAVSVLLLSLAGAGFYFGYYTNSKLAYGQALNNSGKALSELTNQLIEQPKVAYKGYTGSGTYKVESESFSTDGKLSFKTDDKKNSETTFDVGVGVSRVDVAIKSFPSAGTNPDIYIKAGGIKGLGDLAGPELGVLTTKYEDKWIVIDHTLLDNAQKQLTETNSGVPPTSEQIISEVNAFSNVNQQYLFSTDKDKAVTVIKEDFGMKTVDGRKVFHYEVGFNKPNLKKYFAAQEKALKASKLDEWIEKNDYSESVEKSFDELTKSVDDIKDSDSFDMYVDVKNRIIYKFRFEDKKNPAANYVDVGLDYKGGDELPFFVTGKSKDGSSNTTFNVRITGNPETKAVSFKLVAENDASDKTKVTSDFTFKPSTTAITISKPEGAVQLAALFEELGFGDPFGAAASVGETLGISTSKKN